MLRTVVEGKQAGDLAATVLREKLVTRLDHAAYLGRELTRAEIALKEGTPYNQDRAPDEIQLGKADAALEDAPGPLGRRLRPQIVLKAVPETPVWSTSARGL